MLIQHHTKYKEIDGVDEIVLLPSLRAHSQEHWRLRQAGRKPVPMEILRRAGHRSPLQKARKKEYNAESYEKMDFFTTVGEQARLCESIIYNVQTGHVRIRTRFKGNNGRTLYVITEPSATEAQS